AVRQAVERAGRAAEAGESFAVARLGEGLDGKALQEAFAAVAKVHPMLPMLLVAPTDADKASVFAGVPAELSKKLSAGDWLKAALGALGGKGGGKPTAAQGVAQGANEKLDDAVAAAEQLAKLKL
ncbi:hypothetical protein H632_c1691p1, partial [Helicosporidium sp. ATCC 50920]